jgi:phosphate transport system substrate-binding protein
MVFSGVTEYTSPIKMTNRFTIPCLISSLLILFNACTNEQSNPPESILSGKIYISADESFQPITDAEMATYNAIYEKATILCNYKTESEVVKDLLLDSVELIVIGRDLDAAERSYFYKKEIPVQSYKLGTDAIALVVNDTHPDSLITYEMLSAILNGRLRSWKKLNPALPDSTIHIVIDRGNSSNLHSMNHLFNIHFPSISIMAAGSNRKVLDFVRINKTAIGLVGASWINDLDDPEVRASLKGLKVLSVLKKDSSNVYREYSPFQSYLGKYGYPLSRDIYMISQNKNKGPGIGFVSFALSERGQRIVLKSGLLPAKMPGRELEIK